MMIKKAGKSAATIGSAFILVGMAALVSSSVEKTEAQKIAAAAAAKTRASASNLLENGGFELDSNRDGLPDGWTVEGGKFRMIASPAAEGKRALRLEASGLKEGRTASLYQRLEVVPSMPYRLEVQVLAKRLAGAKIELLADFFDADGQWVGDGQANVENVAGGFVPLKLSGVVPAKAAYAFILLRAEATRDGGGALAVVDAFSMLRGSGVPPKPSAASSDGTDKVAAPLVDGVDVAAAGTAVSSAAGKEPRKLAAVQEDGRLYALVQGEGMPAANAWYIDSDGDADTGSADGDWYGAGIDYKIQWNKLWKFDPITSDWLDEGAVYTDLRDASAGFAAYLDDMGVAAPDSVKIGYRGADGTLVPDKGRPLLSTNAWEPADSEGDGYRPKELYGPLNNPFVGWAPASRGDDYKQPFSLVTASITWRDLEPTKGVIDWEGIDKKYDMGKWAAEGKRIVIRIVMDNPGDDPDHMDIPDWLYQELVNKDGARGAGTWYRTESGSGFSPNYESTTLIREHERMIRSVADRWENDPAVAFIQIGSLGHFGEFHTALLDRPFPSVQVSDAYVQAYADAFVRKRVGMRKPFPIAAESGMGLFNDMFGETDSTEEWLDWIRNGWPGIRTYAGENGQPEKLQEESIMPDFWTKSYSGGEFASNRTAAGYVGDDLLIREAEQIRESHTSWLGASALSWLAEGDGLTRSEQANADYLRSLMGYRFVLESVRHPGAAAPGNKVKVEMRWNNKGVAPFYYPWKLELALADANGAIVPSSRTEAGSDIRGWLPGSTEATAEVAVPAGMTSGRYKLLVAVIDPESDRPGVRLAITGRRDDGWYELDDIDVQKGDG